MECSTCGGYAQCIGVLGGTEWFRCRQCGSEIGREYDADIVKRYDNEVCVHAATDPEGVCLTCETQTDNRWEY